MNMIQLSGIGIGDKHVKEFDVIKTNLLLNLGDKKIVSVLPTAQDSEVAALAADLAGSLARGQRKVLLVTVELGNQKSLGIEADAKGIYDILTDQESLENCVCETDIAGLAVLPAGEQPEYAAELLSGVKFTELLGSLKEQYDLVFVLLPALTDLIDGIAVASKTDGCIVVTFTNTAYNKINGAVSMLRKGTDLIGTILIKKSSSWKPSFLQRKTVQKA